MKKKKKKRRKVEDEEEKKKKEKKKKKKRKKVDLLLRYPFKYGALIGPNCKLTQTGYVLKYVSSY